MKGWVFGGPGVPEERTAQDKDEVLGLRYSAVDDTLHFPLKINFSAKKQKVFTEPDLLPSDIPAKIPLMLTRRLVLQQVMAVYDPLGFLSPFVLEAKLKTMLFKVPLIGEKKDNIKKVASRLRPQILKSF